MPQIHVERASVPHLEHSTYRNVHTVVEITNSNASEVIWIFINLARSLFLSKCSKLSIQDGSENKMESSVSEMGPRVFSLPKHSFKNLRKTEHQLKIYQEAMEDT